MAARWVKALRSKYDKKYAHQTDTNELAWKGQNMLERISAMSKQETCAQVPIVTRRGSLDSRLQHSNRKKILGWFWVTSCVLILEIMVVLVGSQSHAQEPLVLGNWDRSNENTWLIRASSNFTTFLPLVLQGGTWRPFSDASPWNIPIPANPETDPNSPAMIANLQQSSSPVFWTNIYTYTVPVWKANSSTPRYHVTCTDGYCGPDFDQVPIPDEAVPDPGSDAHMLILDLEQHKSWDMWNAHKLSDGSWQAGFGTTFDLTENGVKPYGVGSARGSGFPLAAGLIFADEVKAGHVRHALVMAYDWPRDCLVHPPASTNCGLSSDPNSIPIGAHLQLDPSLDLDTLNLSPGAKVVARAMQEYGLYIGDNGWGLSLFAESFYGKPANLWDGLLRENDLVKIPIDRLRVLKLDELRCDPMLSR
jgi:hypothetical protein